MSNQTYGTRELLDILQRPNPYDVYKDVAQRMKDAGFTQKPTMSRVLEELSPTDPADKSGLDAFERLLKERGLITKTDLSAGYYASELGNFMRSTADKVLLMELGMRQWRKAATLGLEQRKEVIAQYRATLLSEDSIIGSWERPWFDAQTPRYSQQVVAPIPLSELVAMTTPIDTDAYRSVYLTYSAANVRQYRVGEGAGIPIATIGSSQNTIRLYKFGRGLRATYEQMRRVRVDKFAIWITWLAIQAEIDKVAAGLDVIVNGDGNNNAAATHNLTTLDSGASAGTMTFKGWQSFKQQFDQPYMCTTALMQKAIALQVALLNSGTANVPLTVAGAQGGLGKELTPINQFSDGVRYGWTADAPSNQIVGFDRTRCLEHVIETGSEIAEMERYVTNQVQEIVFSQNEGFAILDKNAAHVLVVNA